MKTLLTYRKPMVVLSVIVFTLTLYGVSPAQTQGADQSITGPWLWMIAPTTINLPGSRAIQVDSLSDASGGTVTEACVARNGANIDSRVGNYTWTLSTIRNTGIVNTGCCQGSEIDNVTDVVQRIGWANGNVDYHSSYALITLESAVPQNNALMKVGSDDAIKVWLNGEVVHTNPVDRASRGFQDEFRVNLKQGDNLLLVKVSEGWGNWSMFVSIDATVNAVYKSTNLALNPCSSPDETDETASESTDEPPSDLTSGQTLLSSDEFNGSGQNLDPSWHVKNGDRSPWTLKDGQLVVDAGFNQNLWRDDTSTRFYQVMDQDQFTLETSMVVDYTDVCAVTGLVVYSPTTKDSRGRDGNWVTLKFWGQQNRAILQYQHREREIVARQPGYNRPQGSIPVAMRLERDGNDYEAWFKPDAQGEWVSVGKTTLALQEPLQVGVYAGICQGQAPGKLNVKFDYFRVTTPELITTPSTLDNTYNAQDKLTGPWLWMIAPTAAGQGGTASTNVDSLAAASGGAVTEADVAANGANEGDKVGALEWTLGEISATGGNNINDLVEEIGLGEGNIDDHSSYALITLESDTAQSGVTMRVGSDDSIKVWLNGEVVHINAVNRGAGDFQDTFKVNLKKGDNLLLVKVSERGGGWSMFVGLDVNVTYKVPTRDVAPVPADDAYPAWDVNEDGQTNITDLIVVLAAFEKTPIVNPRTDVNGNGTVDKQDIIIVATHLGESTTPAAPISVALPERLTPEMLQQALDLLRAHNDGSFAFQRGIAHLEQLLALLTPKTTALLANYPNPFNPETWIPYELENSADVSVRIYSVNGSLVRRLSLGHQAAGMYQSRSRAAYWDGKNEFGESVASGVYFYTLTAGDFTATRKMLIRK